MVRANHSAHPIHTLGDAIASLETSILLCLARPGKVPVHALRTSIRRIEAHLELLSVLPQLPPHDVQGRKARRLLKKIRRAAGRVRDLDVQRSLIQDEVSAHVRATRSDRGTRADARHLRRKLKRKREHEASRLQHLLDRQRERLPRLFETLLDALAPAESIALSQSQLTALVQQWYRHATGPDLLPQDAAELHRFRKRAKLARFMAESAPQSAVAAHRLAARFAALQKAGGEWHDWLILASLSAEELGPAATLSSTFAAHAQDALRNFQRRLRRMARQ